MPVGRTNQHCDAIATLAPEVIAALSAEPAKLGATMFGMSGKGLTFTFSSKGPSQAVAALAKH